MKKGFTLIELLAVIVILAIIALIAIPIVLNIVDNTKERAKEESARNYVKAVELAVARKKVGNTNFSFSNETHKVMSGNKDAKNKGNICLGDYNESTDVCDGSILKVELDGELPISGIIVIENQKIKKMELVFNGFKAEVNESGSINITSTTGEIICTAVTSTQKGSTQMGTKYKCKVNNSTSYNFYVLSTSGDNVSLIMENNLVDNVLFSNSTSSYCFYETCYSISSSEKPYAMREVERLTSTWTKIPELNESYVLDGSSITYTLTGRARLPKFSEMTRVCPYEGTVQDDYFQGSYYSNCLYWVFSNLSSDNGYWTMGFSNRDYGNGAIWAINSKYHTLDDFSLDICDNAGYGSCYDPEYNWEIKEKKFGIRPVITVNKSNLG